MSFTNILVPILFQITLTLSMFILLGVRKTKAIKSGDVDRQKTALDNSAWPEGVVKVSNNIANQFQTPVLFYVLAILFYITHSVTIPVIILSWIYVLSRFVHAFIHISSNFVPMRFSLFLVGVICLVVMSILAFINIPLH